LDRPHNSRLFLRLQDSVVHTNGYVLALADERWQRFARNDPEDTRVVDSEAAVG
jgi:hypothetical protein